MPNINQILRQPSNSRDCSRGAPLGDSDVYDGSTKLHLQRVRLVDGDYGPDGTYWGGGSIPLWCAFNPTNDKCDAAMGTRIYVRARSRSEAKQTVQQQYGNIKFFR